MFFYIHTCILCTGLVISSVREIPRLSWQAHIRKAVAMATWIIWYTLWLCYKCVKRNATITLYTRQQKRHWCIEQSFGLCGRGRGWEDLGEWHWNMYNIIYKKKNTSLCTSMRISEVIEKVSLEVKLGKTQSRILILSH